MMWPDKIKTKRRLIIAHQKSWNKCKGFASKVFDLTTYVFTSQWNGDCSIKKKYKEFCQFRLILPIKIYYILDFEKNLI